MTHEKLKSRALYREAVKTEYDALEPEFTLLREMLMARQKAGLSQLEIAGRMGSTLPQTAQLRFFCVGKSPR